MLCTEHDKHTYYKVCLIQEKTFFDQLFVNPFYYIYPSIYKCLILGSVLVSLYCMFVGDVHKTQFVCICIRVFFYTGGPCPSLLSEKLRWQVVVKDTDIYS